MLSFRALILLAATLICFQLSPAYLLAAKLTWQEHTLKLTGESDAIRKNAIKALSKISNLEEQLNLALQNGIARDQSLALDVLTVFRFNSLVPTLRSLLEKDETGQMHLALATLSAQSEDERHKTAEEFLENLQKNRFSHPAATLAILSTFSKWRLLIPKSTLEILLSSKSFEVRLATLTYIRTAILEGSEYRFVNLLNKALTQKPFQLRVKSLYLVKELPKNQKNKILRSLLEEVEKDLKKKMALTTFEFKKEEPLGVGVFFGYKDARPSVFVSDAYEQAYFSEILTKPCNKPGLCGFVRDEDDIEIFRKKVISKGATKTLHLRLVASSAEDNDERNRKNPFQKWQSQRAESLFYNSLQQDNAVFYNGHSRDGGGPDFEPPKLTARGLHVDYSYYRKNHSTFNEMKRLLRQRRPSPAISVELYSCASKVHFQHALLEALGHHSPTSLRLFSELIYTADAMNQMTHAIEDLILALQR